MHLFSARKSILNIFLHWMLDVEFLYSPSTLEVLQIQLIKYLERMSTRADSSGICQSLSFYPWQQTETAEILCFVPQTVDQCRLLDIWYTDPQPGIAENLLRSQPTLLLQRILVHWWQCWHGNVGLVPLFPMALSILEKHVLSAAGCWLHLSGGIELHSQERARCL